METFYGKTCNFAFPYGGSYTVSFGGFPELNRTFSDVDSCILWAAMRVFAVQDACIGGFSPVSVADGDGGHMLELDTETQLLQYAWATLTDVNVDEDEQTEQDWFIFPAGTDREDIWHWFDERNQGGVARLLEADDPPFPNVQVRKPTPQDVAEARERAEAKEKDLVLSPRITREMVEEGYKAGLIRVDGSPNMDGPVCWIGEHWFCFDPDSEGCSVRKYKAKTPEPVIIGRIYDALDGFLDAWDTFGDEYTYYAFFLVEHGVKPHTDAKR